MKYLLAIDQGTTGTKVLVCDERMNRVAESYHEFPQHFPQPGWVEHDLDQLWESVTKGIKVVSHKVDLKKIIAIGITNQRETICFWDRKSIRPLGRAIVWQDRRTAEFCADLKKRGMETFFQENTGLLLDPYFSGSKISWALKNHSGIAGALKSGSLAMGTIDCFLIAKLTGGEVYATEPSNASRTLCYHLTRHEWAHDLCQALGIPKEIFPEVRPSMGNFGVTQSTGELPAGIPITGVLGDQQAALLGQACLEPGTAKCTYGTGAFLLMNTGKNPIRSRVRLLSTIAWATSESDYTYALEGSAFIAGAAVQWLRDGLKIIKSSQEVEALAASVPDSGGVTFVPALTGLGAPYWDPHATGMLTGLTRGASLGHLARSVLEGICFQNVDLLLAMQRDIERPLQSLNVDGGASKNNLMMQIQADLLGVQLIRPKFTETTSLGALFAAGIGAKIWPKLEEIKKVWQEDQKFDPKISPDQRQAELKRWAKAIERVRL